MRSWPWVRSCLLGRGDDDASFAERRLAPAQLFPPFATIPTPMETPQQIVERALQLHMAGNVADAEALYRQTLDRDPNNPAALHLLGVALSQQGRKLEAVDYIQ